MKLKTRVEKGNLGGFFGRVICEMRDGRWLWSERSGVERVTREDAKSDAAWLFDLHKRANATMAKVD